MDIPNYSPHLRNALHQTFRADEIAKINLALELAMKGGGGEELDYKRPTGMSYNPRPARIALILLRDAKIIDAEVISAALIATILEPSNISAELLTPFPARVIELSRLARQEPTYFIEDKSPLAFEAATILLAIHLDRARHIHLVDKQLAHTLWPSFYQMNEIYLTLAERRSPALHQLLQNWHSRFGKQLTDNCEHDRATN